jgi:predicted ArsR family transcriptional regulator
LCCGAALLIGSVTTTGSAQESTPPVSACEKKVKQGQDVIRRIMQQLDTRVDQASREAIMESCGRACFEGAYGKRTEQKPTPEQAAKFLEGMRKYLGSDGVKQVGDRTVVYFKYTANPKGLKTADGYCLCPIFEDAPKDISPTYCRCSVGYVQEMFERRIGKPANVEVTETVLRGGQACRFTVSFST